MFTQLSEEKKDLIKPLFLKRQPNNSALWSYFDGKMSLDDAIELIKKNSRHLAKRQYTFFNNQFDNIKWFYTDYDNFNHTINDVMKYIKG